MAQRGGRIARPRRDRRRRRQGQGQAGRRRRSRRKTVRNRPPRIHVLLIRNQQIRGREDQARPHAEDDVKALYDLSDKTRSPPSPKGRDPVDGQEGHPRRLPQGPQGRRQGGRPTTRSSWPSSARAARSASPATAAATSWPTRRSRAATRTPSPPRRSRRRLRSSRPRSSAPSSTSTSRASWTTASRPAPSPSRPWARPVPRVPRRRRQRGPPAAARPRRLPGHQRPGHVAGPEGPRPVHPGRPRRAQGQRRQRGLRGRRPGHRGRAGRVLNKNVPELARKHGSTEREGAGSFHPGRPVRRARPGRPTPRRSSHQERPAKLAASWSARQDPGRPGRGGPRLLERMPALKKRQELRKVYQQLVDGKLPDPLQGRVPRNARSDGTAARRGRRLRQQGYGSDRRPEGRVRQGGQRRPAGHLGHPRAVQVRRGEGSRRDRVQEKQAKP